MFCKLYKQVKVTMRVRKNLVDKVPNTLVSSWKLHDATLQGMEWQALPGMNICIIIFNLYKVM